MMLLPAVDRYLAIASRRIMGNASIIDRPAHGLEDVAAMAFVFRSIRLERIEHERRRTSHALQARIPRACQRLLPARRQQPRAGDAHRRQLDRDPGAYRARHHHPLSFALLSDPYSGAKELSY